MKLGLPRIKIADIVVFFLMWAVGVGLFSFLLHYIHVSWQNAFFVSVIPALIWTIIGTVLANKDETIANGRKAISDAVSTFLQKKY